MGLWTRARLEAEGVSAFGKLPWADDFLRQGTAEKQLVDWVERGMAWGRSTHGPDWPRIFLGMGSQAFVLPGEKGPPERVLVGLLTPSQDAVGRLFPWLVTAAFPLQAVQPIAHLMPLHVGDFLETAYAVTSRLLSSRADVAYELQHVRLPQAEQLGAHQQQFEDWVHSAGLSSLWTVLFGEVVPVRGRHAIQTLIEAVAPLRGQETPLTPLGIRLPLGSGGVAAAGFWIHAIRCAAQWRRTVPSAFWPADASNILVHFGNAPDSTLAQLALPDQNSDVVCDVTSTDSIRTERFLGDLPGAVRAALGQPGLPVAKLLEAMKR